MLNYSFDEMIEAINGAKNMNAALKKILKNEPNMSTKSSRFIKDFRVVCNAKDPSKKSDYLKDRHQDYSAELLAVVRYAYLDSLNEISGDITNEYADKFNTTYEQKDGEIEVKDPKTFKQIVAEVTKKIESGLKDKSLPSNDFLKSVLLQHIFDTEVLKEIYSIN